MCGARLLISQLKENPSLAYEESMWDKEEPFEIDYPVLVGVFGSSSYFMEIGEHTSEPSVKYLAGGLIAGKTLLGLSNALVGQKTFEQLEAMIYDEHSNSVLDGSVTQSHIFSSISDGSSLAPAELVKSVFRLVTEALVTKAKGVAMRRKSESIFFLGSLLRSGWIRKAIRERIEDINLATVVLLKAEYSQALGAILCNRK